MPFRLDYLPFGLVLSRVLQESASSKGPRVPSSIHSTRAFIETQHTTLMRIDFDPGITEFSDIGDGCRRDGSAMTD